MLKLHGIYPPLPTSFDSSEELDTGKMKENIQVLSRFDLAGFLVLGSNGELVHLTDQERVQVYRDTREAIPSNKRMLAGTGCQSTRQTIALTQQAGEAGADAALVLNPSYYKGLMTPQALRDHYFAVADASPIPLIVYNMPANTGLDMDAETITAIAAHDNIIGLKDSGGNIVKMGLIRKQAGSDFQILAGSAGFLLPGLSVGAIGGVLALANIAPEHCLRVYQSFLDGDMEAARENQINIIELNTAVTRKWGVPALKAAMDLLGLYGGPSRKPLLPADESVRQQLAALLKENNVNF
ncbi:MAG TPA: dihydrodipicolinate synthase family protein [Bacteroidales bacterium]|nr:dihydrodipicolinate synthase family protein [Bacteroidales bacterium]